MSEIQWGLLNTSPNFVGDYQSAFQVGRGLAKQAATQNAFSTFQGDPQGAISKLVSVGAIPEAQSISTLGYQQQQRALLADGQRRLFGGNAMATPPTTAAPAAAPQAPALAPPPAPTAAPAIAAATPGAPAATDGQDPLASLNDTQRAAAAQKTQLFDNIVAGVQGYPEAQRASVLAHLAPQLIAQGVSQDQLSQIDLSDQGLTQLRSSLATIGQKLQSNGAAPAQAAAPGAAAPDPQAAGAPSTVAPVTVTAPSGPAAPPAAPAPSAAAIDLRNPDTVKALEEMQMGGADISPLIALGTATMPKFAPGRAGAPIIDEHTGKITGFAPSAEGIQYSVDGQGNVTGAGSVPGYAGAHADYEAAGAEGKGRGELAHAGQISGAKAGAEASAKAPFDMVTVHYPADTDHPGGYDAQMTMDQFKALHGTGGAGQSAGPAAEQFGKADATAFSKTQATVADPATMIAYAHKAAIAQQAVTAAMAINPNQWTPAEKTVASTLNALGLDSKRANDLSYYSSLIPQVTRGSFTTFPRLEKEFELVKDAIPGLQTPRDAAALTFASIAATNNRNAAYSKFAAQYSGPPSQQALNKAWLASPDSKTSIFADPVFSHLTMDGKPAVFVNPTPAPNGHVYGVFRPGTPNAQTFLVR